MSDSLKAIIVLLLLYSDLMHLANFRNASSWPVYPFFRGQSKYIQAMPSSFLCHHVTYIPKVHDTASLFWLYNLLILSQLPDNIQDSYKEHYQTTTTAAILMHCKQELMHAILSLILNEKFVHAYWDGFNLECSDGHHHRLFLCIIMYSADYLEK